MPDEKSNFDRYLERKRQDAGFRARFEAADQAWDIALQLAALRQARGLTQKQVAELLGTKQQAIARLEDPAYTGHSLSMVRKYVEALGANLDVTIIPAETTGAYAAQRSPKPLIASPLTSSQHDDFMPESTDNNALTPAAAALWQRIPAWAQAKLLANVWCSHCSRAIRITDFRGEVAGGDLVLTGACPVCGATVKRLIESEPDS